MKRAIHTYLDIHQDNIKSLASDGKCRGTRLAIASQLDCMPELRKTLLNNFAIDWVILCYKHLQQLGVCRRY